MQKSDQIIGVIKSPSAAWREKQFDSLAPLFAESVARAEEAGRLLAD